MENAKTRVGLTPFDFGASVRRHGLAAHAERMKAKGLGPLQAEAGRVERWVIEPEGLGWRFDFTKQLLDGGAWDALRSIAEDAGWHDSLTAQFAGAPINETEGRAVLHMALRGGLEDGFQVAGKPVMEGVVATRDAFL
ncbi:MAG: hypothetical protein ACPGGB_06840, partial [Flavobacteriales bacterium]